MPPSLMFGQEMFSSRAATPSASDAMRETSTYSSSVVPQTLTMTVARRARSSGSFSSRKRRTPMPCNPIAFSMPAGVSTIRGGGCPSRASRNSPLVTSAPSEERSTRSAYSTPYPKQPLAATSGFFSTSGPRATDRSWSGTVSIPQDEIARQDGAGEARTDVVEAAARGAERHDAAVAAAEPAAHDPLYRDLARPAMGGGRARRRGQQAFGPARIDHDADFRRARSEPPLEGRHDAAALPAA